MYGLSANYIEKCAQSADGQAVPSHRTTIVNIMKAIIPVSPENLGGQTVTVEADAFRVLAERNRAVLIELIDCPPHIDWLESFELMYCQRTNAPDTIKVIRKATEEERKLFRVPLWIQGDDVPVCCNHPMFFVGQIDDDNICMERPKDAKIWWHDQASFYIFTCSQCLESKAVGQQM